MVFFIYHKTLDLAKTKIISKLKENAPPLSPSSSSFSNFTKPTSATKIGLNKRKITNSHHQYHSHSHSHPRASSTTPLQEQQQHSTLLLSQQLQKSSSIVIDKKKVL